jgi:hypothetical protein
MKCVDVKKKVQREVEQLASDSHLLIYLSLFFSSKDEQGSELLLLLLLKSMCH